MTVVPSVNVTVVSLSTVVSSVYNFPGISFLVAKVGFLLVFKISTRLEVSTDSFVIVSTVPFVGIVGLDDCGFP